jgi:hypothetical protein
VCDAIWAQLPPELEKKLKSLKIAAKRVIKVHFSFSSSAFREEIQINAARDKSTAASKSISMKNSPRATPRFTPYSLPFDFSLICAAINGRYNQL